MPDCRVLLSHQAMQSRVYARARGQESHGDSPGGALGVHMWSRVVLLGTQSLVHHLGTSTL